ncbi:hemin ABC transporter ATP-binding subunit [bacterium]|nr:hemin ABC transporter ATP-binding subunit [bacterium]|tara:strand:+ start:6370 stop:7170 length:801 start_codon:yes stop_codon:yes gene_type:complete
MTYQAKNISFSYAGKKILNKTSVEIQPGEIVTILGPNGCGKTTLIKILSSEIKPDKGDVSIGSKKINEIKSEKLARIRSVVSQKTNLTFGFSVREVIEMGMNPYGQKTTKEYSEDIDNILKEYELEKFKNKNYLKLSAGEQQRVNIARSIVQLNQNNTNQPKYLLMDEPTSSLDIHFQIKLAKNLKKLSNKNVGIALVLHDINMALSLSDRIVLFSSKETIKFLDKPFEKNLPGSLDMLEQAFKSKFEIISNQEKIFVTPFFQKEN